MSNSAILLSRTFTETHSIVNTNVTGTGSIIYNSNDPSALTLGDDTDDYTGNTTVLAGTLGIAADETSAAPPLALPADP